MPSPYPSSTDPELAIVDLTVQGISTAPFNYNDSSVVFNYGGGSDPFNHPEDSNIYGPSPMEDYTPFMPPDPLRSGTVAAGQTARGLVILRLAKANPYILIVTDTHTADRLVQWQLTSR